jgi:hypothetical protein
MECEVKRTYHINDAFVGRFAVVEPRDICGRLGKGAAATGSRRRRSLSETPAELGRSSGPAEATIPAATDDPLLSSSSPSPCRHQPQLQLQLQLRSPWLSGRLNPFPDPPLLPSCLRHIVQLEKHETQLPQVLAHDYSTFALAEPAKGATLVQDTSPARRPLS